MVEDSLYGVEEVNRLTTPKLSVRKIFVDTSRHV